MNLLLHGTIPAVVEITVMPYPLPLHMELATSQVLLQWHKPVVCHNVQTFSMAPGHCTANDRHNSW